MFRNHRFLLVLLLITLSLVTACGAPSSNDEENFQGLVDAAVEATLTHVAEITNQKEIPTQTEPVPTETEIILTDPVIPTETPELEIIHEIIPDAPTGRDTFVSDLNSFDNAAEKSTLGDYYQFNRMERPFSAEVMDYFGDLDIVRVDLDAKSPWFYMTFILADDLREEGTIHYGVELDLIANGRGDFLIWAALPPDSEWTTDGVQVLEDTDRDVGGIYPAFMNDPDPNLNGYETIVFNGGVGDDPDLAWVRRDPEVLNQVQIAFKESIPGPLGFLWSAWADGGLKDPGQFEYNDQYTFEEAGSPTDGEIFYPLKMVALVDSTCRSWFGMTPVGYEPGLCTGQWMGQPGGGSGDGNGNGDGNGHNGNGKPKTGFCRIDPTSGGCGNYPCELTCSSPVGAGGCKSCTLP